jgi:hypothetical protein
MKKEHLKKCADCHEKLAEFHRAAKTSHEGLSECEKTVGGDDLAKKKRDHNADLAECHSAMADQHDEMAKAFHEACEKSTESSDLEKITPTERALLATLAKSVIPDRIRATGTRENPNRIVGRAGDPAPSTSDSEIPQEFIEAFQL